MSAPVVDAFLRYSWDCGDQGIGADISRDNNIRGDDCPVTDRDIGADHRAVADSNGAAVDHDTVEVAVEVGAYVDIGAILALKSVLKVDVRACSPQQFTRKSSAPRKPKESRMATTSTWTRAPAGTHRHRQRGRSSRSPSTSAIMPTRRVSMSWLDRLTGVSPVLSPKYLYGVPTETPVASDRARIVRGDRPSWPTSWGVGGRGAAVIPVSLRCSLYWGL